MCKYDNIPISDKTRAGMTLSIDDLAAIGRMLSLQDNAYEEQFEELKTALGNVNNSLDEIKSDIKSIQRKLSNHERRIKCLEREIEKLIA